MKARESDRMRLASLHRHSISPPDWCLTPASRELTFFLVLSVSTSLSLSLAPPALVSLILPLSSLVFLSVVLSLSFSLTSVFLPVPFSPFSLPISLYFSLPFSLTFSRPFSSALFPCPSLSFFHSLSPLALSPLNGALAFSLSRLAPSTPHSLYFFSLFLLPPFVYSHHSFPVLVLSFYSASYKLLPLSSGLLSFLRPCFHPADQPSCFLQQRYGAQPGP